MQRKTSKCLRIPKYAPVTLGLNGKTLDRGLTSCGFVAEQLEAGRLSTE